MSLSQDTAAMAMPAARGNGWADGDYGQGAPRTRGAHAVLIVSWTAILLASATILLHAGLVPAGHWQGDEYFMISLFRELGMPFPLERILYASPRPFSETVLWLYGRAVVAFDRPFIGSVLALLWAALYLIVVVCPSLLGNRKGQRWLIGSTVMALFLLGHPVGEMFYWPQGAAAYLPAIGGIGAFTLCVLNGDDANRRGRLVASLALTLAAGSAEAGAMAAVCMGGILMIRETLNARVAGTRPHLLWLIFPTVVGAVAMWIVMHGRVAGPPEVLSSGTYHSFRGSVIAAATDLPGLLGLSGRIKLTDLVMLGLATAGFVAMARIDESSRIRPLRALALACGLMASAYVILASAYYQFGMRGGQRHDTFHACLTVLVLLSLATGLAPWTTSFARRMHPALGPGLLIAGLLAGGWSRVPPLISDYRAMPVAIAARAKNWEEARQPGPLMIFRVTPTWEVWKVTDGDFLPPGHYVKADNSPWYVVGIMRFFRKTELEAVRAP